MKERKDKLKTSSRHYLVFFIFTVIIAVIIYSCDDNTTPNNPGSSTYSISGTITFNGTSIVASGGSYNVSAFNAWYPTGSPNGIAIMNPVLNGGVYTAIYSIAGLSNGNYFLASAWTKEPYVTGGNYVLGTNGCDTMALGGPFACRPDSIVVNGSNVININFISYIDTANSLVEF